MRIAIVVGLASACALARAEAARPLDRAAVVAGMQAIRPALDGCAATYAAAGVATVKLTIAPAGTVAAAAIEPRVAGWGDFDAASDIGRCIVAAVRAARFPRFDGAAQTVEYPVVLGGRRGTLDRAQDAYVAGRFAEAITLAQPATATAAQEAWRIIGASSCFLGRAADAAAAAQQLDAPGRRFVGYVCARHGVHLDAR